MGIVGVARDLAAHFGLPFTLDEHEPAPILDEVAGARVIVEAPDRCPRFVALAATVTMGSSPEWMQRRLTLAGMRPISNVVDVTNYVMLERCRPLHAYDLGRLAGRGLVVRLAHEGEKLTTLDGVERDADERGPAHLRRRTRAAGHRRDHGRRRGRGVRRPPPRSCWSRRTSRRVGSPQSSKRLGLRSEASARFERGVDPNNAGSGAVRAMELFDRRSRARCPCRARSTCTRNRSEPARITRAHRAGQRGARRRVDGRRDCRPPHAASESRPARARRRCPTFRPDITREIDLIEEVARARGLQHISRTVPSNPEKIGGLSARQRDRRTVADVLVGAGYDEVYTLPLLAPADLAGAGVNVDSVIEVENPLRAEESILRPALLPGLLRSVAHNAALRRARRRAVRERHGVRAAAGGRAASGGASFTGVRPRPPRAASAARAQPPGRRLRRDRRA